MSEFGYSTRDQSSSKRNNRSAALALFDHLAEADAEVSRIIPLDAGSKAASFDHTDPSNRQDAAEETIREHLLSGGDAIRNYGVYAGDGLVVLDVDDHEAVSDALEDLPATFTTRTAHGGEHRFYLVSVELLDRSRTWVDR